MSATLRTLERADLPFLHALFNDPEVTRYWFVEPTYSLAAMEDRYNQRIHDESERRFVIDDAGRRCGLVELVDIDLRHRNCEFQIIVAPEAQGNGYAGAATRSALDYAFRTLNLHKVYLLVDNLNAAAIHVYQKAGFVSEGVLRQEYFADGAYQDVTRMAIYQRDYLAD
ncbi:putative acetyltransferase [Gordonia hirsuta DSM 44140 = NBRC 16056]|uniref:Putative acetyltransferase n=1 Tax=Gordonia hirsuta DSM 44140 = NBRC 16056 TaxID=1121927 RepID=L7L9L8_9ACTN|nr:GNAT family N-acetyltransferase [Gordonia hirsuta]GAC57609.1 putative acetyltransferase [Gordonia hirsuta DSM 44140 = NBRC 16056]